MRTKLAVTAAVTLFVLAGCAGSLPGGDSKLDGVENPPGVSDSDVDADTLVEAHEAALANRSFTFVGNLTSVSGTEAESLVVRSYVGADRDRILMHVGSNATYYFTPDTVYVYYEGLSYVNRYHVLERTEASRNIPPMWPTGFRHLWGALVTRNFEPSGVTTENGTTFVVLTADDTARNSAPTNVQKVDGRALADERGVVHRVEIESIVTNSDGDPVTSFTSLRVTDIGETDVPEPDWLDEAEAQDDNTATNRRQIFIR